MVHPRRKISGPANALQRAGDRILASRWMGGDLTLVRVVRGEDERLRRGGTALCHPERATRVEGPAPHPGDTAQRISRGGTEGGAWTSHARRGPRRRGAGREDLSAGPSKTWMSWMERRGEHRASRPGERFSALSR